VLRLKTLRTFDQPAAQDKTRAAVTSALKALEGTVSAGRARLAQRRAAVSLAESRVLETRQRVERARDQISRTTVRAASPGLVTYREIFFGTDKRKPQPGDEVWPNQPLVAIPDPGQLVVEARVRETDLHRIGSSQRVTVGVDAYPGVQLPASVAMVGAIAESDPGRAGVRYFPIIVRLHAPDERLRTGMTARIGIEVASRPQALLVPVEALVDDDGVTRCYVAGRAGVESRTVIVDARNDIVAAIRSGLAAGERVVLPDPSRPLPQSPGR
jgi:HlyD family secretion protein